MRAQDLKLMRLTLATIWLVTGTLSLGIYPQRDSLELLGHVGLHGDAALLALYGSAMLDIALGVLTLLYPTQMLWCTQAALVLSYSVTITVCLPWFWLHPFGPILKNLPILLLLWLLHQHQRQTS